MEECGVWAVHCRSVLPHQQEKAERKVFPVPKHLDSEPGRHMGQWKLDISFLTFVLDKDDLSVSCSGCFASSIHLIQV
jgi:hypothetical protein